jgi:hypothetical protein
VFADIFFRRTVVLVVVGAGESTPGRILTPLSATSTNFFALIEGHSKKTVRQC